MTDKKEDKQLHDLIKSSRVDRLDFSNKQKNALTEQNKKYIGIATSPEFEKFIAFLSDPFGKHNLIFIDENGQQSMFNSLLDVEQDPVFISKMLILMAGDLYKKNSKNTTERNLNQKVEISLNFIADALGIKSNALGMRKLRKRIMSVFLQLKKIHSTLNWNNSDNTGKLHEFCFEPTVTRDFFSVILGEQFCLHLLNKLEHPVPLWLLRYPNERPYNFRLASRMVQNHFQIANIKGKLQKDGSRASPTYDVMSVKTALKLCEDIESYETIRTNGQRNYNRLIKEKLETKLNSFGINWLYVKENHVPLSDSEKRRAWIPTDSHETDLNEDGKQEPFDYHFWASLNIKYDVLDVPNPIELIKDDVIENDETGKKSPKKTKSVPRNIAKATKKKSKFDIYREKQAAEETQ